MDGFIGGLKSWRVVHVVEGVGIENVFAGVSPVVGDGIVLAADIAAGRLSFGAGGL